MTARQPPKLSLSVDPPSPAAGAAGARIGRPPQWTESKSRKLARLYLYTTLPVEKIIKAVFPDESVKYDLGSGSVHLHESIS